MVLDPKTPTKAVCPWMDAKFLLVVGEQGEKQETFYAATMLDFISFCFTLFNLFFSTKVRSRVLSTLKTSVIFALSLWNSVVSRLSSLKS